MPEELADVSSAPATMAEELADSAAAQVVDLNFWREGRTREDGRRGGGGGPPEGGAPTDGEPRPEWASDDAVTLQLAAALDGDWHYVRSWDDWLYWTGQRWLRDETLSIIQEVRKICRATSARLDTASLARSVSGGRTIFTVEKLARSDDRIALLPDAFDANPWLLNTPGGIVDLRTGELHGHARHQLMTQMAGAAPEGDCPTWRRFLNDFTGGDRAYQDYLQRLVGYSLTGSTKEEMFAFLYGPSNTGKSKFVETLRLLHGTYAGNSPMSTFVASQAERHPTDLAGFVGKRLITAAETDEGRRWDQQRMTQLTGRDLVDARFMRGDFFSYYPQFLLLFHGNHRPRLSSVDAAMRRRMHLLPCKHRPPRIDKDLIDKLKSELGGIMLWAVLGAVLWKQHGLMPPPIVLQATDAYFTTENVIQQWVEERCDVGKSFATTTRELYSDYKEYAKAAGEYVLSERRFGDALENLGFDHTWQHPQTRRHGFAGVQLKGHIDELGV